MINLSIASNKQSYLFCFQSIAFNMSEKGFFNEVKVLVFKVYFVLKQTEM